MTFNRDHFFAVVRTVHGPLSQPQVDGFNAILAAAEILLFDAKWTAYVLATAWWETAKTMQPIAEIGRGKGHPYGTPDPVTGKTYYGRGFVQLTWKTNYAKLSDYVHADLVADPDKALDLDIAVQVLFDGMQLGLFTGHKLAEYFTATHTDWLGARKIVNGTDHASDIAALATGFSLALTLDPTQPAPPAAPSSTPKEPTVADTTPNSPLVAAHPQVAAALPGVNVLSGIINLGENLAGQLLAGAKAAGSAAIPQVSGTPTTASGGMFFGTIANAEAAAGKIKEIIADAQKKDIVEAVADGEDLLKLIFATLDTFKIDVPVLTQVVATLPSLHAGGVDQA